MTRATILLTYPSGNTVQLYHNSDGYPEFMGKLLESFCNTAFFVRYGGTSIDNAMNDLLKMEKDFEFEEVGFQHQDVEYTWYVTLSKDGYEISYVKNSLWGNVENEQELYKVGYF